MNLYILLFIEFFKTGLFAVGGGLATLPFLINLTFKYDWFDKSMLADMVAVSQSTPGPIGINVATYAGFHSAGILGGLTATFGIVLPSLIVIILIAKFLEKFKNNHYVDAIFQGLRPASIGLIAVAAFEVIKIALLNIDLFQTTHNIVDLFYIKSIVFFVIIFLSIMKYKKHPIVYIGIAAVIGMLFKL
ncbi:MAG: chromate transporter [Clostridium butyricum]|nr:chromate transporter [Clostridium butyricum]